MDCSSFLSETGSNMIEGGEESFDVNKNLGNDWIPQCPDKFKPAVLQPFPDLESVFQFYKEYGRVCGFDIRKSSEKHDTNGNIVRKYYLCSRAGKIDKESSESEKVIDPTVQRTRRTSTVRCGCPAKLIVVVDLSKGFYVWKFTESHNHPFAGKGGMQFLRCSRSLTEFHKRFIVDAAKCNLGSSRAHAIFKSLVGSYEEVGATVVDFKNFSRDIKQYIGKHDADMIVRKFKDIQTSSDCEFRFDYKTDGNNHLTQLFWADGVGRRNYEVFGDVVSFDATYRTNRYGMVFIPLVGIDNHWKSVTFGSILLEREDNDNYIWACEAFKKVFITEPKCIITDQDLAMKVALNKCFPRVKHRLCMWHIMKKFPSKLGSLFCAESPFMEKLNMFVWSDHVSPEQFEKGWSEVVSEFGLQDNKWLTEMYDLRASWIPAFFNDEPMVGLLRTTSRSESSNFYFNHYVQKGDTLSEFYLCYQSAIEKQRNVNDKLNHYDNFMPTPISKKQIAKEACSLYTKTMFYKIQGEIIASAEDIEIISMSVAGNTKTTKLRDPLNKHLIFEVCVDLKTCDVTCSCKLYTRVGYLCCHSFFCLGICGIKYIPQQYVNNRWLKRAEERFSTLGLGEVSDPNSKTGCKRSKTKDCWFEFQGCIGDALGDIQIIDYFYRGLQTLRKHIKESAQKPKTRLNEKAIEDLIESEVVEEVSILNPNQSNNKGSRKRLVGSVEKSIACKKRKKRVCKTCHEEAFHDSRNCPNAE